MVAAVRAERGAGGATACYCTVCQQQIALSAPWCCMLLGIYYGWSSTDLLLLHPQLLPPLSTHGRLMTGGRCHAQGAAGSPLLA